MPPGSFRKISFIKKSVEHLQMRECLRARYTQRYSEKTITIKKLSELKNIQNYHN